MKKNVLITGGSGFIGVNLIELLIKQSNYSILNIDVKKPPIKEHLSVFKMISILDKHSLIKAIEDFKPEIVIHLSARTDTDPKTTLKDYEVNTLGSYNLIEALEKCPSIKRVIFTSTQFVNQYHGTPEHDEDFAPHTVYGESKVLMEQRIRQSNLPFEWVIIRPTNIWGPWHIRYPYEFWNVLSKGLYIHPGGEKVMRSYGYVGNVVWQILHMMNAESNKINHQVFYVGDKPI
ncbi:MAG: NAD(P)-dependent oxidoreductase, partial [Flavobacteriales bacterium]|nr:NAD(P)-dependent oxidoreductase [Flavobacteriales bacterium]